MADGDNFLDDKPTEKKQEVAFGEKDTIDVLPATCTIVERNENVEVYIVGTAHFSKESQEDVAKVLQRIQPHVVFLELCRSRLGILDMDEERLLQEAKDMSISKMNQVIRKNGVVRGVMHLLLVSMSAKLTEQLGMAPGGEFRRAFQEARRIPSCRVVYGDRPIAITLQRALNSLSVLQKIRFAWHMLTSDIDLSAEDIEKCKEKDMLEQLMSEMAGSFPAITRVFVDERDIYLAYSLKRSMTKVQKDMSQNGFQVRPIKVVGVLGIGHVNGVVSNWNKDLEKEAREVMHVPRPSLCSRGFSLLIKTTVLAGTVYGIFFLGRGIYRRTVPYISLKLRG